MSVRRAFRKGLHYLSSQRCDGTCCSTRVGGRGTARECGGIHEGN